MNEYQSLLYEIKILKTDTLTPEITEKSLNSVLSGAKHRVLENFHSLLTGDEWLNIKLLEDDKRWLSNILFYVHIEEKKMLLDQYRQTWVNSLNEPDHCSAQNNARNSANTWIRQELKKRELS